LLNPGSQGENKGGFLLREPEKVAQRL